MPLVVRPMLEDDIVPSLKVQHAAFHEGRIGKLLDPSPQPSPEFLSGSKQSRLETMQTNKAARFMLVEDTDLKAVIAAAHWDVYPEERTKEQIEKLCHKSAPPPGSNAAMWNDFFGHFSDSRRALGTRPIAVLHTLVTAPDQQGRGAGKLLLQKFTEEVDKYGLEGYLEASAVARPLYGKFGFVPEFEKQFDLSKYSNDSGIEVNTVMLRPAKKASA